MKEVIFAREAFFSNFPEKYSFGVIDDFHTPFLNIKTDLAIK